jgi:hypothetical protein
VKLPCSGEIVYLDLGQIGESKLEVIGYDNKNERVILKHDNGKIIDLSIKDFVSLGGYDE